MAAISSYAQRCGPAARSRARYSNSSPTTARPPPADRAASSGQGKPDAPPAEALRAANQQQCEVRDMQTEDGPALARRTLWCMRPVRMQSTAHNALDPLRIMPACLL